MSKEDPVRVYDAFVESLDFSELGIALDEQQVGNSEYEPKRCSSCWYTGIPMG